MTKYIVFQIFITIQITLALLNYLYKYIRKNVERIKREIYHSKLVFHHFELNAITLMRGKLSDSSKNI